MKGFNIDMKSTVAQSQIKALEQDFVDHVNSAIASKVTPVYNLYLVVCSCAFGYLLYKQDELACFAVDSDVIVMDNLANTQKGANCVSKEFWLLANSGIVVTLVGAFLYFMQSRSGMFDVMRPYVILNNLITLAWFVLLQYYRFKPSGRACSGDFG